MKVGLLDYLHRSPQLIGYLPIAARLKGLYIDGYWTELWCCCYLCLRAEYSDVFMDTVREFPNTIIVLLALTRSLVCW